MIILSHSRLANAARARPRLVLPCLAWFRGNSGFHAGQVLDAGRRSIYNVDTVVVSCWRSIGTHMEVGYEEPYSEVGQ